jgi:hypothetical protein
MQEGATDGSIPLQQHRGDYLSTDEGDGVGEGDGRSHPFPYRES